MKKLLFVLFLSISNQAFAGEKINVIVKGMVCSFCSQGITKKFQAQPEVATIKVNLDEHLVTIETKAGASIKDEVITKTLSDSGYSVEKISR